MHKQIQNLSNFLVYENKLTTFDTDWQNEEFSKWYNPSNEFLNKILKKRVTFINSRHADGSKINHWEVKTVKKIAKEIYRMNQDHFNEKTLGVISPFRLQCRTIINELPTEIRKMVTVDTVERFQGSERDIIIISFATNYEYLLANIINEIEIDGKSIDRKLNVAITRAKEHLIILGNETILSKSKIYASAIDWIKENGTFVDFSGTK
jgi:DNA replication ATP-dependent helicase Dna2